MKASEENIFPVCDHFFDEHKRIPTADEVIAISGGGKKEVLIIKKRWEALHYLKQNGLNIPTRWLSMLGDYFKATQEDVKAEKEKAHDDAKIKIDTVNSELTLEREAHQIEKQRYSQLVESVGKLKEEISSLKDSLRASELQLEAVNDVKSKQSAEISEKTLQVRLQIDQINDLKQEHEVNLDRLKQSYETALKDHKGDIQNLNDRIEALNAKYDLLGDKLMVSNSERERLKTELSASKKNQKKNTELVNELSIKNTELTSRLSEFEMKLSAEREKSSQIPKLEKIIETFKRKESALALKKRDGLEQQVSELSSMLKTLSEQVKLKEKDDEQSEN